MANPANYPAQGSSPWDATLKAYIDAGDADAASGLDAADVPDDYVPQALGNGTWAWGPVPAHSHDGTYIPVGDVAVIDKVTQVEMDAMIAGGTTVGTTLYVIDG